MMEAKSQRLRDKRPAAPRATTRRLPTEQRRREIVEKAADFFAEFGLTGQTRQLADACGVSQRLIYSLFPSKAALLDEVYVHAIAGPFKAIWTVQLQDRRIPIKRRLAQFYKDYAATVLTRRWVRLFLYCALAQEGRPGHEAPGEAVGTASIAPTYTDRVLSSVLDIIAREALTAHGLPVAEREEDRLQIAWVLHSMVTHAAVRRHAYGTGGPATPDREIDLFVAAFLGGLGNLAAGFGLVVDPGSPAVVAAKKHQAR